jgi:peroxiredoxin
VELREVLEEVPDLEIAWVMSSHQISPRSLRFIDELGLRDRIHFLIDEDSSVIRRLGVLKKDPEPMETGVPHPTTYLIDREGVIRFADVRSDFHIWLDPKLLAAELARMN